jgi:hypothetical protein
LPHIETIISESSRMLGFIKRISREFCVPYTLKILYISLVRPNLEHATCVWSPHQPVYSEWLERVQRLSKLPVYDARCLLIGLEVLSDSFLFARDILIGRAVCADLALMLRFKEVPYSRRVTVGLLTFFHRPNYGRFKPVNNAIINFSKYCHWFGFCGEVGRDMFRDRLKSALSGERFSHRRLQ